MLALVNGETADKDMESEFNSKLKVSSGSSAPDIDGSNENRNVQRSKSFAFKAPQENFNVQDFELGKIYGVGSYSKVCHFLYFLDSLFTFEM